MFRFERDTCEACSSNLSACTIILGDVGAICNDTAYAVAHAHCGRLKERLMQLNDRLTGSRFLRGVNRVGGVACDLTVEQMAGIVNELDDLERDFSDIEQILSANASLIGSSGDDGNPHGTHCVGPWRDRRRRPSIGHRS